MAGILKGSINLSMIPKDKIIEGKKGKYIPVVIAVNDETDQFGNHGPITVDQTKEERDAKAQKTYLGNIQCVWTNGNPLPTRTADPAPTQKEVTKETEEDLPF